MWVSTPKARRCGWKWQVELPSHVRSFGESAFRVRISWTPLVLSVPFLTSPFLGCSGRRIWLDSEKQRESYAETIKDLEAHA